jgi:hypothetical protein
MLDQRSLLVLLLVLESCRGQDSFFAPYCDILPTSYGTPKPSRCSRGHYTTTNSSSSSSSTAAAGRSTNNLLCPQRG